MKIKLFLTLSAVYFLQQAFVFSEEPEPQTNRQISDRAALSSRYSQCIYPMWENGTIRLINYFGGYINEHSYEVTPPNWRFSHERNRYLFLRRDGQAFRINSTGKDFPINIPDGYDFKFYLGNNRYLVGKKDGNIDLYRIYSPVKEEFLTEDFIWYRVSDDLVFGCLDVEQKRKLVDYYDHGIGDEPTNWSVLQSAINLRDGTIISCPGFRPSMGLGSGLILAHLLENSGISKSELVDYLLNYKGEVVFELPKGVRTWGNYRNDRLIASDERAKRKFVLDRSGNIILEADGELSFFFSNGLAKIEKPPRDLNLNRIDQDDPSRIGYINRFGEEVIPCQYLSGTNFYEGVAIVQDTDKNYHLINTFGDILKEKIIAKFPQNRMDPRNAETMLYIGVRLAIVSNKNQDNEKWEDIIQLINFDGDVIWSRNLPQTVEFKDMLDYYGLYYIGFLTDNDY